MSDLHIVDGLIFVDHKILLVQKKNRDERLILPGGKIESGEHETDTLIRELNEELQIERLFIVSTSRQEFQNLKTLQEKDFIKTLITYKVMCANHFLRNKETKRIFLYSKKELSERNILLSPATALVVNSLPEFTYY